VNARTTGPNARTDALRFEARHIDVLPHDGAAAQVVGIWCELDGRFRRFTVDNVRDLQRAGREFYVRDAAGEEHAIHVIGASPHAHLHTNATGIEHNALVDLSDWGHVGHSAGHSNRPPPVGGRR
jgi:hypothetical protein